MTYVFQNFSDVSAPSESMKTRDFTAGNEKTITSASTRALVAFPATDARCKEAWISRKQVIHRHNILFKMGCAMAGLHRLKMRVAYGFLIKINTQSASEMSETMRRT
jgi:hypothetical protein